ncbi:Ferrous iron transport protein B [hydrothermal vent metagenome]|uniref:Ferrous iron transport protein B n=1 Tax=hydrothermal vent metagenome TaxID=652676 RepID=A0A3B1BTS5_9ZZZZ
MVNVPDKTKEAKAGAKKKIAIIGPANVGKSIIFNRLSKSYSEVANYPQTTVGSIHKESNIGGIEYEVWDTPGISSLDINSEDERITRDALLKDSPDFILFTGDPSRLKRSLILLSQILELNIPTVLVLNKMDEASLRGITIDTEELSERLGIPVVETAAEREAGFAKIGDAIKASRPVNGVVRYPIIVENALDEIGSSFKEGERPSKAVALLLLSGVAAVEEWIKSRGEDAALIKTREAIRKYHRRYPSSDIGRILFNARKGWADKTAERVISSALFTAPGLAQKAAWASRHPVLGWPIVLAIMWITFYGVGTIATQIATYLDMWIFIPLTNFVDSIVTNKLANEFLVGNFGVLTMGVMNALVTVVPILIIFFLIINFLEDVGYLPNLSVLLNRMFSYLGLTGKSVLTMSLGFGCNTMATLTSRSLETKKERIIAISLIALGVPCAVQLGVMIAILSTAPFSAILFVVGAVLITQITVGMLMNWLLKSEKNSGFIMELPPFRWPNPENIARKTYYRVKSFLVEALPLFVLGAVLMFIMEKTGILAIIITVAHPVITGFLSLPDKATEVFILVLSRRELGAVYFKDMVDAMEVDYYQIVVGLTVMTLFIPCVSNTMVMIKELGLRWAAVINMFIMIIAILVGGLLNSVIRLF